jgi:formylglycine-generating enzyme required for sulfatase activity
MVVVPAGSFAMGSPDSEEGRIEEEGPQHRVTFGKAFGVGKFAVTFEEWDACVADGGCDGYTPSDEGWGRGRRPAIHVSWDDAKAYVGWLSRKTGKTYRLLSEAEREYVIWHGSEGSIP